MQIENKFEPITKEQQELLAQVRTHRRFSVEQYVNLKVDLFNKYMKDAGLKSCVVATSGGIDSAVVLALVKKVAEKSGIRIVSVCLPSLHNVGVTDQHEATLLGYNQAQKLGVECYIFDVYDAAKAIHASTDKALKIKPSDWAIGQLSPYTRTPYLYYITTLLKEQGYPSVLVGTTNRDEGSYLGYVGKASDGMVDIQLISDLHKSEVRKVAKYLNVMPEIQNAIPKGDMFDGKCDEDIFGASYDFLELYLNKRTPGQAAENLEKVHRYNAHKYLVGSPAVHLDLYESGTAGGWPVQFETKYWKELKEQGDYISPKFVAPLPFANIKFDKVNVQQEQYNNVNVFKNILSENEIQQLTALFNAGQKKDANINGYADTTTKKGSSRATLYNIELAETLWNRLRPKIDLLIQAKEPITDWNKNEIYRLVGINPCFRFIGYENDGLLVPHYDYAFEKGGYKTLFSVILYLTTNKTGATRFLSDPQEISWQKDLADWTLENKPLEKFSIKPAAGSGIVFPHHLLHDCQVVENENKLIIRTDIVAQKIGHS